MPEKFIITPKEEKTVTITVRINRELNTTLETLSLESGRSRNELINKALKYALSNVEFKKEAEKQ